MKLLFISLFISVASFASILQPAKANETYLDCQSACTEAFFECTSELECASKSHVCLDCCYNVQDMCSNKCDRKFANDVMFRRAPAQINDQSYEGARTTGNDALKKRYQALAGSLKKSLDGDKDRENAAVSKHNENILQMIRKAWVQK